jgi:AcrR family transcriptional regulator
VKARISGCSFADFRKWRFPPVAQRNREAILAAARQVFCDRGLEAPLEEIARRAGVGIGTLYRRFPNRVELLDAVLAHTVQAHLDLAERALLTLGRRSAGA